MPRTQAEANQRNGTVFAQAYTPSVASLVAVKSLLTGVSPVAEKRQQRRYPLLWQWKEQHMSGDIADFTIANLIDPPGGVPPDDGSEAPAAVACRICGKGGLSWTQQGESWRLQEPGGGLHPCLTAACRHCGAKGLHWDKNGNGRWRLYAEGDAPHHCPVQPLPEEPPSGQAGFLVNLIKRARTVRFQATESLSLPLDPKALTELLSDPCDGPQTAARLQYNDRRLESDGFLLLRVGKP